MRESTEVRIVWIIRWTIILSAAFLIASVFTLLVMNSAVTWMGPIAFFAGAAAASIVPTVELSLRHPLMIGSAVFDLTMSFMLETLLLGIFVAVLSTIGTAGFLTASFYVLVMAGFSVLTMPGSRVKNDS